MEKPKNLFQDLTPEQRAQALRDNCHRVENTIVTRAFTTDEIQEFKNSLAEKSVELQKEKMELDKVKKEYDERMKPSIESIKETTKSLRLRYSETLEDVFLMDNHETSMMETYDIEGVFLSSRPLRANEKQLSIVNKTGTN